MELVIATKNKKKLEEIKIMLDGLDLDITSLADYEGLPEIIEDGKTFAENAAKKATTIAQHLHKIVLGEDSGLEVDALGGKPGIFSARFAGKGATDNMNNRKLLKELGNIPTKKRTARYVCAIVVADEHGVLCQYEGMCEGYIATKEKGEFGFGYDPLFMPENYGRTMGQLGGAVKHRISHRYKAFQKVKNFFHGYLRRPK